MNFQEYIENYQCDACTNNRVYRHFTEMTESLDFLIEHRKHVEARNLGFGDRAFHYMWFLIIQHLALISRSPKLLEIGVYKGQVISLWSLLSKHFNYDCEISCVTPLRGNVKSRSKILHYWNMLTNMKFRSDVESGNLYSDENYQAIIQELFNHFDLDFNLVKIYKGLSTDGSILEKLRDVKFDLIYIDGDHTQEIVERDIHHYSNKVNVGGLLVMDDASCNIPGGEGGVYWKGHKSVSNACEVIPRMGFVNVLNVGHNRIYQRTRE